MRQQRIQDYQNSRKNEPVLLLGNGPSLKLLNTKYKIPFGISTIGMNRSWEKVTSPYHCIMFHKDQLDDLKDWDTQHTILFSFSDQGNEKWIDKAKGEVVYVATGHEDSITRSENIMGLISLFLDESSWADLTGHFAIEVALWLGFNPIYLLGYDCYGGHFCDDKTPEPGWQEVQADAFELTAMQLRGERPKTKIYNLSLDSVIPGFEKLGIGDVLTAC